MKRAYLAGLWLMGALILSGCGEVRVYDVDTKFSNIIQVEPISKNQKTVFIRIKDATGYASELASTLETQLKNEGYTVVAEPSSATFKLMVRIIKIGPGTAEDQITFMQAIDPAKAAELSIAKNKTKIIHRHANSHEMQKTRYVNSSYTQGKNDAYIDDEITEISFIAPFADRTGIADVEIINISGLHLKTRLMVGVNMRGGLFVSPKPAVDHFGWGRLIQRFAQEISNTF